MSAVLTLKRPRTRQPEGAVDVDWSKPLARGLQFAVNPASGMISRSGISPASVGANVVTETGRACNVATTYPLPAGLGFTSKQNFTIAFTANLSSLGSANAQLFSFSSDFVVFLRFNSGRDIAVAWTSWDSRSAYVPTVDLGFSYVFTKNGGSGAHYVNGKLLSPVSGLGGSGASLGSTITLNSNAIPRASFLGLWDRSLLASEVTAWHGNPWQLFAPRRCLYIPTAGAATAPGVPTSLLNQNLAATSFRSAWTAPA